MEIGKRLTSKVNKLKESQLDSRNWIVEIVSPTR